MSDLLEKIQKDLYNGYHEAVVSAIRCAIEEGLSPDEILDKGLIAGMEIVGQDFYER